MPEFRYQEPFPVETPATTKYRLVEGSKSEVTTSTFKGEKILKVAPEALRLVAREAMRDVSFLLRPSHLEQVAAILDDPEASANDRGVALAMLRNAEVAAEFVLPLCQDTGTATVMARRGSGSGPAAATRSALSRGIFETYTEENLRYSQTVPLDMYEEKNTGTTCRRRSTSTRPTATSTGSSSSPRAAARRTRRYLFQETKALLNPRALESFLVEKMRTLGTAACPPYHLAFVIGGTSAEAASRPSSSPRPRYLDRLPTSGNARRARVPRPRAGGAGARAGARRPASARSSAASTSPSTCGSIRLPRHGASCPVGIGVSCSADRNVKAKIDTDGVWLEELEREPGALHPRAVPDRAATAAACRSTSNRPMARDPAPSSRSTRSRRGSP